MNETVDSRQLVGDVVAAHPSSARVFRAHGIDFCCGGRVPIEDACADQGLDARAIVRELDDAIRDARARGQNDDVRGLGTADLVAHIVDRHHAYLRRVLPHVVALAAKVARVHGDRNGHLVELNRQVSELARILEAHLDEEERVLFPAMTIGALRSDTAAQATLASMTAEHRDVGDRLRAIRASTEEFTTPSWACTSYRTLFSELASIEDDTLRHIHLENNVLAPRFTPSA